MVVVAGPDCLFHWGSISFVAKIVLHLLRHYLLVPGKKYPETGGSIFFERSDNCRGFIILGY